MSADTRQRIIDTALHLFATKGYGGTSMNDIIGSINISKGSVYWHFPSKEAIFLAVIRESFGQWFALLDEQLATIDDPVEKLRAYSRLLVTTIDIPAWQVAPESYRVEFEPATKEEIKDNLVRNEEMIEGFLTEAMDQGLVRKDDVKKLRWIFFAMLEGVLDKTVLAYQKNPDSLETAQAYAAEAMEMFLSSIRPA